MQLKPKWAILLESSPRASHNETLIAARNHGVSVENDF